jgi:MraZ protein
VGIRGEDRPKHRVIVWTARPIEIEVGAVFLGTHTPRLDDKGRLALPARFRSDLEGGLVITKGQERCLFVFPVTEFTRLTQNMNGSVTDKKLRSYSRVLFASASHEVPDAQGRITVPPALRSYAGLEKDCVVIGANNRVEVWDAANWQTYLDENEQNFADAEEETMPGFL